MKSDDEDEMEEEGGICYVGIRGGEEEVYVRDVRRGMLYGGCEGKMGCGLLREMGETLVDENGRGT
ncbi:hypothetical protein [Staphylococcus auricularis]|uniref:hypothetical protein n=1 Tax=Staphylococcus auricularis TaxID=29379 RepID=UPI001243AE87|nr:hypothetical protein [Staphylococcus auricularis]